MPWHSIFVNAMSAAVSLQACYYALLAIGLNVQFGYAGLANFGQVAFLAFGGYGMAMTVVTFHSSLWLGLLVGVVAAILLALLLGIPTLRLRSDYLAIATIAAAAIIQLLASSVTLRKWMGGSTGLTGFSGPFDRLSPFNVHRPYDIGPFHFPNGKQLWIVTVGWTLVAIFSIVCFLLMRSPWGRVLKAIREDEDAARALGKNVYSYKMQALIFGAIVGAFAGFVLALGQSSVVPAQYSRDFTFLAYAALILGGTARVLGPVVGSMVFWLILSLTDNVLRAGKAADYVVFRSFSDQQIGISRQLLVGLALMLLVIFRPQGMFGNKNEIRLDAQ